ncbi:MAG: alpha,alpha-trehalose-phosphate synthase (UDP-forming) [Candidatus Dormibacteria bacterium]
MPGIEPYLRRMLHGWQPIVVANRPPVESQLEPGGVERISRGAGGLVTAMGALAQASGASWVAVARGESDARLAQRADQDGLVEVRSEDGSTFRIAYIHPDPEAYRLYYSEISNPLLLFIQHYLWDLGREPILDSRTEHAWRDGYVAVNAEFADRVVRLAEAGSARPLILSQDYHLYLMPLMIRRRLPEAHLQHFIHIPWPTPQYWKVLPRHMRDGIITGLLGNDVIGLQTSLDVRNFLLTCEENLGLAVDHRQSTVFFEGRSVWIRAYPISIDVRALTELVNHEEVRRQEQLLAAWRPEFLILRVDRTDLSKNIVRGFLAYERLLDSHPELRGRVVFWAFLQRSRQNVDAYRSYLGALVSAAAHVNRRFQTGTWTPIRLEVEDNLFKAVAAYKSYDALLVNPIYDGMNLVAKEGALCNTKDGVLVLSENAGSHEELGSEALTINPFDIDQTAEALHSALTMPKRDRSTRARHLRQIVRKHDIVRWITAQLQDLNELVPR